MPKLNIESGGNIENITLQAANDNSHNDATLVDASVLENVSRPLSEDMSTAARLRSSAAMPKSEQFTTYSEEPTYISSEKTLTLDPESPAEFSQEVAVLNEEIKNTEQWFSGWSAEAKFAALTQETVRIAMQMRDSLAAARNVINHYQQLSESDSQLSEEQLKNIGEQLAQAVSEVNDVEEELRSHFDDRQAIESSSSYEFKRQRHESYVAQTRAEIESLYDESNKSDAVTSAYNQAIKQLDRLGVVVESGRVLTNKHKQIIQESLQNLRENVGNVSPDESAEADDATDSYPLDHNKVESVPSSEQAISAPSDNKEVSPQIIDSPQEKQIDENKAKYEAIRQAWLEAKEKHKKLSTTYEAAARDEYAKLEASTGFFGRIKASFGFGPEITDELDELKAELNQARAEYNKFAQAMVQAREVVGKKRGVAGRASKAIATEADTEAGGKQLETAEETERRAVLERYQGMLSRHTLVDALDTERSIKEETAERLSIKPPRFVEKLSPKQRKSLKYLGAAAIGGGSALATGGGSALLGAGQGLLRVFGAGAIAGGAAKAITGRSEARIGGLVGRRNERNLREGSEYEREIAEIGERLTPKHIDDDIQDTPSAEEFQEMYERLQVIYNKVDAEKRKRIAAILATAVGAGAVMGGGISAAFDSGAESVADVTDPTADGAEGPILQGSRAEEVAASEGMESLAEKIHTAEPGFTVWDYFEGETEAERPEFMERVPPEKLDGFLKQIERVLDEDAAAREAIGLGESSHDVMAGATIDLQAMDQVAEKLFNEASFETTSADASLEETSEISSEVNATDTEEVTKVPSATVNSEIENTRFAAAFEPYTATTNETASADSPQSETVSTEAADVRFAEPRPETLEAESDEEVRAEYSSEVVASGTASEALHEAYGTNPATVYEYIVSHDGGAAAFLEQFNDEFVSQHQSHHLERNGLFGLGEPKYADAFAYMKGMTIGEIGELTDKGGVTVESFLEESGIHPEDFASWVEQIDRAKAEGLITFAKTDRLEETMQAYYIQTTKT